MNFPHDDWQSRAAFYGDPNTGEPGRCLVPVVPPYTMYYGGKAVPHVMFHAKAAPALLAAFNEIWEHCGHSQARVDASGASDFEGTYNPRKIRGRESDPHAWSSHAYGAAIDINAKTNQLGNAHGDMPQFIVDAFERQGFRWGGHYAGRKDFMHFEGVDNGMNGRVGFMPQEDAPQADSDVADGDTVPVSAEQDKEENGGTTYKEPWYKKVWAWVSGGGVGALGVGGSWLSGIEPVTIGIFLAFGFAVFCVVWFTKKGNGWGK